GTFMLGETAETRGLFLGCGMNSVGMASGGGAGMNLAHCILHGHTAMDLGEADAKRFAPVFDRVEHLMARAPEILGTHYDIAYPGKQLRTARDLRRLPLDAAYRAAGAHFGQAYGWERPLYFAKTAEPVMRFDRPDWFENVRAEVMAAHQHAAIFEASPFGKIDVTGPDAEAFLLQTCAGSMSRAPGAVIYTAMLNARGTFESDLTAHRLTPDHYRLFVGTGAIKRDMAWLKRASEGFDVTLRDVTEAWAVLALMGPEAARVAKALDGEALLDLGYFKHGPARLAGVSVRAARLSYVGEAGWEITCRSQDARTLYAAMIAAGARPAGLFAQTSMRIEKGFCAMGHELDGDLSPIDVGLGVATRRCGGFTGAEGLAARRDAGAPNRLVSLSFEDDGAVPIGHEPLCIDGQIVGQTTSCAYGYRIGRPIALALTRGGLETGTRVEVDLAGTLFAATVSIGPLFDAAGRRMREPPLPAHAAPETASTSL
ncbi:MAG: glycine cleavage T C-terminal barrel domain-containing protein, partial [Pseudomonadota bacterium]